MSESFPLPTEPEGVIPSLIERRYPGNPLWGDGWGWALYQADAPNKQVATNYKKDCLGCHVPAQSTDWVYVQGYPVLKSK